MKDQWDCVLNDLEELRDKQFLVLMDQYKIEIFSCFLRLFAIVLFHFSSDVEIVQDRSENIPLFSGIQSLHRFLEVDDHDEEEYSVVFDTG